MGGISFKNSHTHIGPNSVSANISNPIDAEVVVLDPMVIHINPIDNCGTPKIKPIKTSCEEKLKDSDKNRP